MCGRLLIETANLELDADYAAQQAEVIPGEYVMIAVSDTGAGMPSDVLSRIFESFFTTKPAGKSTGLGLSMFFRSEEHTSELQSLMRSSYAVFCLKTTATTK